MTLLDDGAGFSLTALRGAYWTYAARFVGKPIGFVTLLVLARLLTREDFGVAAFAIVAIELLFPLRDLGTGQAFIYHEERPGSADTAFWLGIAIAVGLFIVVWTGAPLVGELFESDRAVSLTRLLGLLFPLGALANVHDCLVRKRLDFSGLFRPGLGGSLGKSLASIALAAAGWGAASLIVGRLAGAAVSAIAFWVIAPWRPGFRFDPKLAASMLAYGRYIVAVNVLSVLLLKADSLLIGHFLGASLLGLYTVGFRVPDLLVLELCNVVSQVLFPVYVKMRADRNALREAFHRTLRYVSIVTVPLGVGFALVAEPFVRTFLTGEWLEAVPVMQAISVYAVILSLGRPAGALYKAEGRLGVLTLLTLLRGAVLLPAIWWAVTGPRSIVLVAWAHALAALIQAGADLTMARRMVGGSWRSLARALGPAVAAGGVMALAVGALLQLVPSLAPAARLAVAVVFGAGLYAALCWWLAREALRELAGTFRRLVLEKQGANRADS